MRKSRKIGLAALTLAGAGLAAGLTACAQPQYDDLKGIHPVYPDYAVVVMNVDGFPNVALLCYDGKAELTTTRNMDAIRRAPEFDNICAAHPRNDLNPASGFVPPAGQ